MAQAETGQTSPAAADPAMLTAPDYVALAQKHRVQIDRILMLSPEEQEREVAGLGVNPRALENHYPDLQVRAADLRHEGVAANRKTVFLAVGAFFSAAALTFAKRNKIHENKAIQAVVGLLASFSAGFAATLAGSYLFGGSLKKDGEALAVESRNAFERELAVALENKERTAASAAADTAPAQQTPAAMTERVKPRDPSFTAQAASENQTPAMASQR